VEGSGDGGYGRGACRHRQTAFCAPSHTGPALPAGPLSSSTRSDHHRSRTRTIGRSSATTGQLADLPLRPRASASPWRRPAK